MLITTLATMTTAATAALCYASSRHQRWFARPLPKMLARSAAAVTALAGLGAWLALAGPGAGVLCWLTTLMLSAIMVTASSALRGRS